MSPDTLRNWIAAAGGRRFLMTIGAGVVHTGLRIGDVISQEIYRDLTLATVAVYISASTYQKLKEMKSL